MTGMRRVGAAGAFLQTAYFVVLLLFLLVILPGHGFDPSADNFHNAAIALPFAARSPLRALDDARDVLLGAGVLLAAVPLFELWAERMRGMLRLALVFGIAAGTLLLGSGIAGFAAMPPLVAVYQAGRASDAGGAYLAVTLMTGGLRQAGLFAYGAWAFLIGLATFRLEALHRTHAVLGMVMGAALMLAWLAGNVAAIAGLLAALIWTPWLSVWLLSGRSESVKSVRV